MVHAVLAIQPAHDGLVRIEQVEQWIRIFGQACCEAYDLEVLVHSLEKLGGPRTLQDVDMVHVPLDSDRDDEIWIRD